MQYVETKRHGRFLIPKTAELKLKQLSDRELVIAYLNTRKKKSEPEFVKSSSGFVKLGNNVSEEISHLTWQIYFLQELENRKLISGNESLVKLDYLLAKSFNYSQIDIEERF